MMPACCSLVTPTSCLPSARVRCFTTSFPRRFPLRVFSASIGSTRDSTIVSAAHAVREGRVPEGARPGEPGDFFVSYRDHPEEAAELVERLVCDRIPKRYGMDPMSDVLVLAPMYRGPLGVNALNERLGRRLNPDGAWAGVGEPLSGG